MPAPAPPPIYRLTDRIHHASLVPISRHCPEILWLMRQQVTEQMKECIISRTRTVVDLDCDAFDPLQKLLAPHGALPSPPVTPTKPGFDLDRGATRYSSLPTLEEFLNKLVEDSRIQVPTLLCTLIYLDRIQPRIAPVSQDATTPTRMPDTRHRVLLATIICAAKYLNDSSPKNKHWAKYSLIFRCEEVNLMEQQLLCLLNWELRFTEEDCVRTFSTFFKSSVALPPTPPYEEAHKPPTTSQLAVPPNRRASRPARIEVSTGPNHLHSSYSRSSVTGNAPLSPPPSASRSSLSEVSSEEGNEEEVISSEANARYATYGYSSGRSTHVYVPPPRYAAPTGSWSRREDTLQNPDGAQETQLSSTTSWPALSTRANGFLERVWGGGSQNARGSVKNSRSVGGIFRMAQPESSGSRV